MESMPGDTASGIQSEVPIPTPAPLVGSGTQSTASQVSDRAPIDVAELFAEFPEVSAEDRVKIENFESEQCKNHFMYIQCTNHEYSTLLGRELCPREGQERIKLREATTVIMF